MAEATLSLLREQLKLQEERRLSDRTWFEQRLSEIGDRVARDGNITRGQIVENHKEATSAATERARRWEEIQSSVVDELLTAIKGQADLNAIPRGDTPTVDEMLAQAKSDPVQRKILEATLAELEFADPQIEFN